MPNYREAKIYKIEHKNMFYIGSTTSKWLCQRLAQHHQELHKEDKKSKVYSYLRTVDWSEVKITLLENYPCNSKDELTARETFYIEPQLNNPYCLNSRCAIPTEQSIKQTQEKSNKRKSDIVDCECGAKVARGYLHQHRKMKCHFDALGLDHTPIQIRSEEALIKQKENAKIRAHQEMICECGATIKKGSRYLHVASKKHENALILKNTPQGQVSQ